MSKWLSTPPTPLRQRSVHGLSLCLLLSVIILLLAGGVALLWDFQQASTRGRAAGDLSVVGPPTVAAATVDAIFARLGSPMVGTGKLVEQASRQANIDDAFALGVWWTETNDGAAGVGLADRNPGSVRGSMGYPSAFDGYTIYPSYTAAISYWFNMLRNNYVDRGLSSVYVIARPYVGTKSYPLWAGKVINLMDNYRGMAPHPPVATPRVKAKPVPNGIRTTQHARLSRQQRLQGLSQETLRQAAAPLNTPEPTLKASELTIAPALPRSAELAIVLLGLLSAMAIALYALRFKQTVTSAFTADAQADLLLTPAPPERAAPTTEELSGATENLPALLQLDFPVLERQTESLLLSQSMLLAPSAPGGPATGNGKAEVAVSRPAGLLSRYRDNSNQQDY